MPSSKQPAASNITLPTPPRTVTSLKRKRSRSRVTDSDTEDDENRAVPVLSSDDEHRDGHKSKAKLAIGPKRRKMLQVDAIAAEISGRSPEDLFWDSDSKSNAAPAKDRGRSRTRTRSPSSSPAPHLLLRTHTGLASPPPSRRVRAKALSSALPLPLPVTPPRKGTSAKAKAKAPAKRLFPERDSPNNPFLASDNEAAGAVDTEGDNEPEEPRTPVKHVERPTTTWVFRGVRAEFANPLYDPDYPSTGVAPPDPDSPSRLPPNDPDFSPTPYCPPKLLFPGVQRRRRQRNQAGDEKKEGSAAPQAEGKDSSDKGSGSDKDKKGKSKRARTHTPSEWDTTDEEDEPEPEPVKGGAPGPLPGRRRLHRGIVAGAVPRQAVALQPPEKDRSDPVRRAIGPVRKPAWRG